MCIRDRFCTSHPEVLANVYCGNDQNPTSFWYLLLRRFCRLSQSAFDGCNYPFTTRFTLRLTFFCRLFGTMSHDHPQQTHLHESDWLILLLDIPHVNGAHIFTWLSKLLSRDLRDLVSVHAYYHNLHLMDATIYLPTRFLLIFTIFTNRLKQCHLITRIRHICMNQTDWCCF